MFEFNTTFHVQDYMLLVNGHMTNQSLFSKIPFDFFFYFFTNYIKFSFLSFNWFIIDFYHLIDFFN